MLSDDKANRRPGAGLGPRSGAELGRILNHRNDLPDLHGRSFGGQPSFRSKVVELISYGALSIADSFPSW
jgi:hypothetical protein